MPVVRHVSVVLVSPSPIEPHSVRPETLRAAKIVPNSWVLTNELSSPVFAVAQYQNGVSIQIGGNRCTFQETVEGPLRDEYKIHDVVRKYLESTTLVPYNAIGVNWLLGFVSDNPTEWIGEQLGYPRSFPGFSPISYRISRPVGVGPATCNLTFRTERQTVLVDCNYHIQLGGSVQPILALDQWRLCQQSMNADVFAKLPD